LASAIMYARILVVVAIFGLPLLEGLALPLGLAAAVGLLVALAFIRSAGTEQADHGLELRNPFEFWMAVKFGLVLAAVILLAQALKEWVGDAGVYLVAGASGFVDVDAATLSLSRMAPVQIPIGVGVGAVLLASVTNTLFKAAIAIFNSKAALLGPMLVGIGAQLATIAIGAVVVSGTIPGAG
jgi:uncharacterized membrane protein (DUF4010 family)